MKKILYIFLIFFSGLAWPQNLPKKNNPAVPDSLLARAKIGILQLTSFSCQSDTIIMVKGNSQKLGYLPNHLPEIASLLNNTKKFSLQVTRLQPAFFSYSDTAHGLQGCLLVSHQPGVLVVYSEGTHQPSSATIRFFAKVFSLGKIKFPLPGRAFLVLTYSQKDDSVKTRFQIYLETGHKLANNFAQKLIDQQYKEIAAAAIRDALQNMLKWTESDSLVLPEALRQ